MEAVLARGDRRLAPFLLRLHEKGARFDAWTEYFDQDLWFETFEELHIDPDFYALRERDEDEIFPWDHLDMGVTKEYLLREYRRSARGEVTPHCRERCSGCGALQAYEGGVCLESKD